MLNGLDEIDWSRLSHAYGSAEDVPGQLRGLASAGRAARARHELYSNIYHQGSRYEATAYAVPFLLELLADPATPDQVELLELLVAIAIGDDEGWLPDGLPVAEFRRTAVGGAELLAAAPRPGDDDFDPDEGDYEYVESLSGADQERMFAYVELTCYDAVRAGVPLFRELLTRPDPALRACAAYALAWFPEYAAESVPALGVLVATDGRPEDPAVVGTALAATGLLGVAPDAGLLTDPRPAVRWGAAVGRARVLGPQADQATVDELLAWAGDAGRAGRWTGVPFLDGDVAGYAGAALRQIGPRHAERSFDVLLGRIPAVSGVDAMPVVEQALRLAFPDGPLPAGAPATALTDGQRRLAEALAWSPGTWLIGDRVFANFGVLVAGFGLPSGSGELRAWLDGTPVGS